jgi:hypothetical protein
MEWFYLDLFFLLFCITGTKIQTARIDDTPGSVREYTRGRSDGSSNTWFSYHGPVLGIAKKLMECKQ